MGNFIDDRRMFDVLRNDAKRRFYDILWIMFHQQDHEHATSICGINMARGTAEFLTQQKVALWGTWSPSGHWRW